MEIKREKFTIQSTKSNIHSLRPHGSIHFIILHSGAKILMVVKGLGRSHCENNVPHNECNADIVTIYLELIKLNAEVLCMFCFLLP